VACGYRARPPVEARDGLRFDHLPSLTLEEIERSLVAPIRTILTLLSSRDAKAETLVLDRAGG
jgi:hypothetical protein